MREDDVQKVSAPRVSEPPELIRDYNTAEIVLLQVVKGAG